MFKNYSAIIDALALAAFGIAATVIVGWYARKPGLLDPTGAGTPMVMASALCMALLALALWSATSGRRSTENLAAFVVCALSSATLYAYAFHTDFLLDNVFIEPWSKRFSGYPGRMAPSTALSFLVLSVGHLRRELRGAFLRGVGVLAAAAVAFVFSAITLLGFVLDGPGLGIWKHSPVPMGFMTACGILALSVGLVLIELRYRLKGEPS